MGGKTSAKSRDPGVKAPTAVSELLDNHTTRSAHTDLHDSSDISNYAFTTIYQPQLEIKRR